MVISADNKTIQTLLLICNITVVSTDIQNSFSFTEQCKESWYWCQKKQFGPFVTCGWYLSSASVGCAVQPNLVTCPITFHISFQGLSFSTKTSLQRCIKPHHLKHFKEDLHHSRGSDIKVTAFLGEQSKFIPNILICGTITVRACLSFFFFFFFFPCLPFCFNYKFQGSKMKRERSEGYLM